GHNRLFSLTLSMYLDRGDMGPTLDFNQNLIHQHLGANSSHLMPRMKTIEMYRKNAKKLSDPAVLFQYAQYMLQTALLLDPTSASVSSSDASRASAATAPATPLTDTRLHLRSALSLSLDQSVSPDPDLRASLLKEAFRYLRRLSDKGYVEAQYFLGDAYSSGAFGKIDNKEAFSLFLSAAKRGHTECAFRTAHCYEEGMGTGRDARKGVEFLKLAASKNHPAAMYKLGIYFLYARMGISDSPVNKKLGIKWLERALGVATELTSAAPYELGKLYQTGYSDILIKDEKYALELFSQAAALGHVEASAILGHNYEVGTILASDPNLSIHYYTKAALGGHAQSMLAMCAWYMVGSEPHFPKDEQEAFEWAKRAASCGHAKAQFVVANFLDKGIGCERNTAEAQVWYIKAAENGQQRALGRVQDPKMVAAITKKLKK
ncbi:HCP-like protein, partial [Metschnikowia bicuspidata var. bicuspidata NRRL YB-4993]